MSQSSDSTSSPLDPKVAADRQLLMDAEARGASARLRAMVRLSGPGWLQSAITLGGGSLTGALFLGVLGGYNMLWIQLVAIVLGVIMLSAISYVTLTTGKRPFQAINEHINPALGWSWALATCTAREAPERGGEGAQPEGGAWGNVWGRRPERLLRMRVEGPKCRYP